MKRKLYLSLLIVLCSVCLNAQQESTVYLNDGNSLKGYISEQTPGKKLVFASGEDFIDLKWSDINYIGNEVPPVTLLSGIIDVVTLKNDEVVRGFMVEVRPGRDIRMDDGKSYLYSNIKTIGKETINENQSFAQQSRYIDRLILKNNDEYTGFIVCQEIGKSVTLLFKDGKTKVVNLKEIGTFAKEKNSEYSPIWDVVLEKGKFVKGDKTTEVKFQKIEPINNIYFVDVNGDMINTSAGQPVVIYANLNDNNANVLAVKTLQQSDSKGLFSSKKNYYETFKYNDFVGSLPVEKSPVSKVGTTTIKFTPAEKGYYVIMVKGVEGFIVIHSK